MKLMLKILYTENYRATCRWEKVKYILMRTIECGDKPLSAIFSLIRIHLHEFKSYRCLCKINAAYMENKYEIKSLEVLL